jgi:F0F1-type ATP synthase assembly protein I
MYKPAKKNCTDPIEKIHSDAYKQKVRPSILFILGLLTGLLLGILILYMGVISRLISGAFNVYKKRTRKAPENRLLNEV